MELPAKDFGFSAVEGKNIFEISLRTKSRPGVLGHIGNLLASYDIDILHGHLQVDDGRETGVIRLYVDATKAKQPIGEIITKLREQEYTIDITLQSTEEIIFERSFFPITSGKGVRIFALDADCVIELERELVAKFGTPAETIMYLQGVAVGKQIVSRIRERHLPTLAWTPELLTRNFKAMFQAYGMGLLDLNKTNGNFNIKIREPLMSASRGDVIDHFSIGVVTGALQAINNKELAVSDIRYDRNQHILSFTAYETPA